MRAKMPKLIRTAREKCNVTQGELAKALDLSSPQYVSNIERGVCPLSAGHFHRVSKILNVSMNALFMAHVEDYKVTLKEKAGMNQ